MKLKEKLAAIQNEVGKMAKNQKGYNYQYFDINQLLEKLKPLCEKHKVLLEQPLTTLQGDFGVLPGLTTKVSDLESEEEFEYTVPLLETTKPQDFGSCITYYRRYALQSLFALEAEDDDAATAQKASSSKTKNYSNNKADVPF